MSNTSATGGYLSPAASPAPLDDAALGDFLQAMVVGITGLPGKMVRPRWQQTPPNIPARNTDWAAAGVTERQPETFAATQHVDDAGGGYDVLYRNEEISYLVSFYGPNAGSNVGVMSDGLQIPQNLEVLAAQRMGLIESAKPRRAPELIKNIWMDRYDLEIRFRRQIVRQYTVLTLLSAVGTVVTDSGQTETINAQ